MRTTLNIDDDVFHAVKELARRERRSAGEVLSELARRGITAMDSDAVGEDTTFYGFRPLKKRSSKVVTNELIEKLRDEGAY